MCMHVHTLQNKSDLKYYYSWKRIVVFFVSKLYGMWEMDDTPEKCLTGS
jgi:hypothetical protein